MPAAPPEELEPLLDEELPPDELLEDDELLLLEDELLLDELLLDELPDEEPLLELLLLLEPEPLLSSWWQALRSSATLKERPNGKTRAAVFI